MNTKKKEPTPGRASAPAHRLSGRNPCPATARVASGAGKSKPNTAAALSRAFPYPKFLGYLLTVLEREVGACGLDTEAGRNAQTARAIVHSAVKQLRERKGKP